MISSPRLNCSENYMPLRRDLLCPEAKRRVHFWNSHKGVCSARVSWQLGTKEHHKVTICNKPHTKDLLKSQNGGCFWSERETTEGWAFTGFLEHALWASGTVQRGRKNCLAVNAELRDLEFPSLRSPGQARGRVCFPWPFPLYSSLFLFIINN